jgi:glycosyltransferase involved in cell wall biosynthesis
MASSRAVLATNVDGIPDAVIDGETGVLVPPDDPGALAEAMAVLLKASERCTELGRKGQQRVRARFTWHQIARQYIDFFAQVTGQRAGVH